jgi:hypothetical protein
MSLSDVFNQSPPGLEPQNPLAPANLKFQISNLKSLGEMTCSKTFVRCSLPLLY